MYLQIYRSEWAEPYSLNQQSMFDQGHAVHREAYKYFPNHILIKAPYWDFEQAQVQTEQAIEKQAPFICEAFFSNGSMNARVDVLQIQPDHWNIIEVKFSSSVKKDHIWDVAIQKYILDQLQHKIKKCFVMYINKECVFPHLENLFIKKDVTEEVNQLQADIGELVDSLKTTLNDNKIPEVKIGPHCHKPYPCRFISHCWKDIPVPSVFDVPGMKKDDVWDCYEKGQVCIDQIQKEILSDRQRVYQSVQLKGDPYIDRENIKKEVEQWSWPLYYLDFETISPPIPTFNGTKSFQHIPFQFSLLRQDSRQIVLFPNNQKPSLDFALEEHYLHMDESDPRYELAKKLTHFIGTKGSIACYYKNFESARLKELANFFPEFRDRLLDIESRLVDPLPLLQKYVCFKEFGSSWSMKSVAPVLLGDRWDYSKLEVQDGLMAQHAFKKMAVLDEKDPKKEKIKNNLISYCRQDTVCLALIVKWLYDSTAA